MLDGAENDLNEIHRIEYVSIFLCLLDRRNDIKLISRSW